MHITRNPATAVAPFGNYAQAVEAAPGLRWLHVSGQVGVTPDGVTQQGFEAQTRAALANLKAILQDAGMDFADVVKLGIFMTTLEHIADYRRVRDEVFGDLHVASTLLVVAGLARPEWQIEIEAVAART